MNCRVCHRPLRSLESVKRGVGPCCAKKMSSVGLISIHSSPLDTWIAPNTLHVLNALEEAGFEALLVGGAVRDNLLGESVNDEDVCTNASVEEIEFALKGKVQSVDLVGKQYGVVIADGVEVAMYRTEEYAVAGKPDVKPARSFQEDSSRRDFTINSLGQKKDGTLLDYHGGLEDIKNKVIRTVGNPDDRFREDYSRMLRAVYFASRFDFTIEPQTFDSIQRNAYHFEKVPKELVGKIVKKVMKVKKLHTFLPSLRDTGLLPYVFPAIAHTVGVPQNPKYHHRDVFGHIVEVVKSSENNGNGEEVQQLGAIFHDNAKALLHIRGVNKEGQPNDLGHEEAGRKRAEESLMELGYGKEMASKVGFLVEHHGLRLDPTVKDKSIVKALRKLSKEARNKNELKEKVDMLFTFMVHDANGFTPEFGEKIKEENHILAKRFQEVADQHVFYLSDLPVNGRDVAKYGYKGKEIGTMLQRMVELDIQDKESAYAFLTRHSK